MGRPRKVSPVEDTPDIEAEEEIVSLPVTGESYSAEDVTNEMRKYLGLVVSEHVRLIAQTKSAAAKAQLIKLAYDVAGVYDKGNAPNVQRNFLKLMEKLESIRVKAGGEAIPIPVKSTAQEDDEVMEDVVDDGDGDEDATQPLEEGMSDLWGDGEPEPIRILGTLPGGDAPRRDLFVSNPEVGDNNYNSISSKLRRKRAKGQPKDDATVAGELLPTV